MSIVLIDARHFGRMLKYARRQNHMFLSDCAKLLKISESDLKQYERGSTLISESVMSRLLLYGLTLMKARSIRFNPDDKK